MNAHSVYHESFAVDWSTVTVHFAKPDMRKVREVITGFVIGLVFFALSFAFCVQAARAGQVDACDVQAEASMRRAANAAGIGRKWKRIVIPGAVALEPDEMPIFAIALVSYCDAKGVHGVTVVQHPDASGLMRDDAPQKHEPLLGTAARMIAAYMLALVDAKGRDLNSLTVDLLTCAHRVGKEGNVRMAAGDGMSELKCEPVEGRVMSLTLRVK